MNSVIASEGFDTATSFYKLKTGIDSSKHLKGDCRKQPKLLVYKEVNGV